MNKYISVLKSTDLFIGLEDDEILTALKCFGAKTKSFKKDEFVFRSDEKITKIAILVKGSLLVQKDDYWGNRSVVKKIAVGEIFGESYAIKSGETILNDVFAIEDSTVIMLDVQKILTIRPDTCCFHSAVIRNLMYSVCAKNRALTQKIDCMAQRTTRGKLTAYLSAQSKIVGKSSFDLPFNRQQLADFLAVDRSAMSNELCKMRDEGMLRFNKNHFELIQNN